MISYQELMQMAVDARKHSYSPYSGFAVGAALLCKDGTVYTGCNIENAAFSPTNCAERTAFFKAVSEGKREFQAIAIAGGKQEFSKDGNAEENKDLVVCYPCGVCRQVMSEFCNVKDFEVICGKSAEDLEIYRLEELLPKSFQL